MEYHIVAGKTGRVLATIRFEGETLDAAGEAVIVQGTEATLERICEIMKHSIPYSKAQTSRGSRETIASVPPNTLTATPTPATPGTVTSLDAFRKKKS
jgi:hypothetical protein